MAKKDEKKAKQKQTTEDVLYELEAPSIIIPKMIVDPNRARENQLKWMESRLRERQRSAASARELSELTISPLKPAGEEVRSPTEAELRRFVEDEEHRKRFELSFASRKQLLQGRIRAAAAGPSALSCVTLAAPYSGLYMDPQVIGNTTIYNDRTVGVIGANLVQAPLLIGTDTYLQTALGGYIRSGDRAGLANISATFGICAVLKEISLFSYVSNYLEVGLVLWDDDNPVVGTNTVYDSSQVIGVHQRLMNFETYTPAALFNVRPNLIYLFWAWTIQHISGVMSLAAGVRSDVMSYLERVDMCPVVLD